MEMLLSVIAQAETVSSDQVEILVLDNASTDDTRARTEELAVISPISIRLISQEANIGGTLNWVDSLRFSNGAFWMPFGDDDIMVSGALCLILARLAERPEAASFLFDPRALDSRSRGAVVGTLSMREAAARYFYYMGNAGVFALNVDRARPWIDRVGRNFFRVCWPQTELQFLAASTAGDREAFVVVALDSSASPNHMNNTIYTSYYLIRTAMVDLYRAAVDIRPMVGDDVYSAAAGHVFAPNRYTETLRSVLLASAYDDTDEDRDHARAIAWQGMRGSSGMVRRRLAALWIATVLPRRVAAGTCWSLIALRHGSSAATRVLAEWRADAGERQTRRRAGRSRIYGPKDL